MSFCKNPDCTYGDQPHFVAPGMGMVGFYLCNPPDDLTNHTRCIEGTCDKETDEHPWEFRRLLQERFENRG